MKMHWNQTHHLCDMQTILFAKHYWGYGQFQKPRGWFMKSMEFLALGKNDMRHDIHDPITWDACEM